MPKTPTVSVLCLTYNQKEYVGQMLDSILMQKTSFDFEVLINDDASTDGTAEIIRDYAAKYPDTIKPNFQKENQYSKGLRNFVARFLLPNAKGKYLAICEGDDYWTDPDKLQLQVDFLDKHKDYALCFHPVRVFFENGEEEDSVFPDPSKKVFTTKELLRNNFIQTNSVMYRKQEYKSIATNVMPTDWYLHLYHAQFGKIGFINKVMAAYRRHPGGIWWASHKWWTSRKKREEFWAKHGASHIAMYNELLKLYGDNKEYEDIIYGSINPVFESAIGIAEKGDNTLLNQIVTKFPKITETYLIKVQNIHKAELDREKKQTDLQEQENDKLRKSIKLKDDHIDNLNNELNDIKNSRAWKALKKARRVQVKIKRV